MKYIGGLWAKHQNKIPKVIWTSFNFEMPLHGEYLDLTQFVIRKKKRSKPK
jgi:hypothetical protein